MNGWACQYCGRANPSDRLTCNGCQAPHRRAETRNLAMTYMGRPLSTLTDAEMDEAADAWMNMKHYQIPYDAILQPLPEAFMDALRRRLEASQ